MTYTIITPIENTNNGYKDTGILGHYRYEDIQSLAELYCQANACIVCDGKQDVKGGMNQTRIYSTKWVYLGDTYWGLPNYLAPEKRWIDWNRIYNLADESLCPMPDLGNYRNTAWLYIDTSPFANYYPYMHEDPNLSAAGTTSGTKALFGDCIDIKTDDINASLGMNRPFSPHSWTDPKDIVKLYGDAKRWSNYDIFVLSWNANMTEQGAYGQAFDQSWNGSDNIRARRVVRQNGASPYDDYWGRVEDGWANSVFTHRDYWQKFSTNSYYSGGYDPTGYHHYEWMSQMDALSVMGSHPSLERNIPIPTNAFGTNCLKDRQVLFVWEAVQRDVIWRQGLERPAPSTKYFAYTGSMTQYGTQDFTDAYGNARGLCMRYTFPTTAIEQQYTAIKGLLNWSIPNFDMTVEQDSPSQITSQTSELTITLLGCYTVQKSYLTERLSRPTTQEEQQAVAIDDETNIDPQEEMNNTPSLLDEQNFYIAMNRGIDPSADEDAPVGTEDEFMRDAVADDDATPLEEDELLTVMSGGKTPFVDVSKADKLTNEDFYFG